jgi:hypothetical protein
VFMTSKGDDGSQAAANTPAPVAKDAHATWAHDDPPPVTNATNDELPEMHGGPRLVMSPNCKAQTRAACFRQVQRNVMYVCLFLVKCDVCLLYTEKWDPLYVSSTSVKCT